MQRLLAKNPADIRTAAALLEEGGIGAFPTETVYGLGADATSARAVAKVFQVKKRPVFDPLIVHVDGLKSLEGLVWEVPRDVRKLLNRFWPGPLTVILPKTEQIPDLVTSGLGTVAVRCPDHPAALAMLRALKKPVAAPSANRFGHTSPTTARAVEAELGMMIDFILDGGPARIGVESTILRPGPGDWEVLRPGGLPIEEIRKFNASVRLATNRGATIEAPGQMDRHYATATPLVYLEKSWKVSLERWKRLRREFTKARAAWPRMAFLGFKNVPPGDLFEGSKILSCDGKLVEAAAGLFESMRGLDAGEFELIVAECICDGGLGLAMDDRLRRAASARDLDTVLKKYLTKRRRQLK
ncbi:MAG: threonylcarbamoyl-AMP synthase [Candidatus Omnitrophica bacterium]|nr:threonylcarbamoyl-AMP synthase [Candidatus Omnitrophota bacterium]